MIVLSRGVALAALTLAFAAAPVLADTVVTSPAGLYTNAGAANASGPGAGLDTWFANNVRNNGAAGITGTYARSGNGSIEFQSPQGGAASSKADFEYYFSAANQFLLSDLTGFSYDFYRAGSSSANPSLHPSLRLYVADTSGHSGYLVYEGIYNGQATSPVDTWTHVDVVGGAGDKFIWSTGSLPDAFSNYTRTASDWATLLPGLTVVGLSTGVGSGWDAALYGAVDNISYKVGTKPAVTFNFETASSAAPEPASWAMMVAGFGLVGAAIRRRARMSTQFA